MRKYVVRPHFPEMGSVPIYLQATMTSVMLALPTVPEPFATVQVCAWGGTATVTLYKALDTIGVSNSNEPSVATFSSVPLEFCSVSTPAVPVTVPPIENVGVGPE